MLLVVMGDGGEAVKKGMGEVLQSHNKMFVVLYVPPAVVLATFIGSIWKLYSRGEL